MSHSEDGQGQLRLGIARVTTMVIVTLLEEGVVCGLIRGESSISQAWYLPSPGLCALPDPVGHSLSGRQRSPVPPTSPSGGKHHSVFESL